VGCHRFLDLGRRWCNTRDLHSLSFPKIPSARIRALRRRRSRKYRAIIGRCEAYAPLTSGYNGLVGGSNPLGPTTNDDLDERDRWCLLEIDDGGIRQELASGMRWTGRPACARSVLFCSVSQ
jgi:hypothetical protein